eukprot:scaffold202571_cov16-Tisochrysis_lutea.AAC.1
MPAKGAACIAEMSLTSKLARVKGRVSSASGMIVTLYSADVQGLYDSIKDASALGVPIYITETGLADAKDQHREHFIRSHYSMVRFATSFPPLKEKRGTEKDNPPLPSYAANMHCCSTCAVLTLEHGFNILLKSLCCADEYKNRQCV